MALLLFTKFVFVFMTCFATIFTFYCISTLFSEGSSNLEEPSFASFESFQHTIKNASQWLSYPRWSPTRIAIIMVIEEDTRIEYYQHSMLTMGCYARIWNYEYRIVNSSGYKNECPQTDKFFRRHCVVATMLPLFDYIFFLDADIGVVNPVRLIEDYIDTRAEIVFYDRFYNWEVMAGGYLVKNTEWAKKFLHGFANYEFRLSNNFHGTDNGALHAYLAEVILPSDTPGLADCMYVYNRSENYQDLFTYEACIRSLLGNSTNFGSIRILRKGTGWARDSWITNSLWSPEERDFMMHSWKLNQLKNYKKTPVPIISDSTSKWYNPLAGPIHLPLCVPGNLSWIYDHNLIGTREDIDRRLQEFAAEVEIKRIASLQRLCTLLSNRKTTLCT